QSSMTDEDPRQTPGVGPRAKMTARTVDRGDCYRRDAISGAQRIEQKSGLVLIAIAGRPYSLCDLACKRAETRLRVGHVPAPDARREPCRQPVREASPERHRLAPRARPKHQVRFPCDKWCKQTRNFLGRLLPVDL